jgi:hypothetical protein
MDAPATREENSERGGIAWLLRATLALGVSFDTVEKIILIEKTDMLTACLSDWLLLSLARYVPCISVCLSNCLSNHVAFYHTYRTDSFPELQKMSDLFKISAAVITPLDIAT